MRGLARHHPLLRARGPAAAPRADPLALQGYTDEDEGRLLFIRQAQALGLTLDDIKGLVRHERLRTPGECRRVAALLRQRIEAIDRKLAELKAFRRQLNESLARCEKADGEACPVVLSLSPRRRGSEGSRR